MPDPVLLLEATGAAAALAAFVLLLLVRPWRSPSPAGVGAAWATSVGVGFALGCWFLQPKLHWPPQEDQDRFILLVMPVAFVIELLAAIPRLSRWLIGSLRGIFAAAVAPVLLYGSVYLTASQSAESWSPTQRLLILVGMTVALVTVWGLLALLQSRASGRLLPFALALTCFAAGVTVVFSGCISGGLLALPLVAALMGAAAASLVLPASPISTGWLGLGIVGLFSVLVSGRFFADLSTGQALVLFCVPLLGWVPELPGFRRLRLSWRDLARTALIATAALVIAGQAFLKSSAPISSSPEEVESIQDYLDFKR
ncbi:MAG TPA: hypothetical protein VH592_06385 [Gemmataceae bacterium]|jgi:hypothetical protein